MGRKVMECVLKYKGSWRLEVADADSEPEVEGDEESVS
jgi:hypothetical protein